MALIEFYGGQRSLAFVLHTAIDATSNMDATVKRSSVVNFKSSAEFVCTVF